MLTIKQTCAAVAAGRKALTAVQKSEFARRAFRVDSSRGPGVSRPASSRFMAGKKWTELTPSDIRRDSSRTREPLYADAFIFGIAASPGEHLMFRMLSDYFEGRAPSQEDLHALYEAFTRIIYGEDPITALHLQRPPRPRRKRDPKQVMRIGQRIEALRAGGHPLQHALRIVGEEEHRSPEAITGYWHDYVSHQEEQELLGGS